MLNVISRSLFAKLLSLFLLASLLPCILLGSLVFYTSRSALKKAVFSELNAERSLKEKQLVSFFLRAAEDAVYLSHDKTLSEYMDMVSKSTKASASKKDQAQSGAKEDIQQLQSVVEDRLKEFIDHYGADEYGYDDIALINAQTGEVLFTVKNRKDNLANLSQPPLKDSGLAKVYSLVLRSGKHAMVDYTLYPPADKPIGFVGAPIVNQKGEVKGVLALYLDVRRMNSIMLPASAMGRTCQSYLVGQDHLMRSQDRFAATPSVLVKRIDIPAVQRALEHKSGTDIMPDQNGVESLISYSHLGLNENKTLNADFDWVILTDVDLSEAFESISDLWYRIIIITVCIGILAFAAAFRMAKSISEPISRLSHDASKVSEGNLNIEVSVAPRKDEIGNLVKSFHDMVNKLRDQTRQILEGVSVLASASTQISSTVSQVAASSSETSSAVTETTTTLEELRQTGRLASDKAKNIAEEAKKSVETAQTGKKATDEVIEGMNLIEAQMESIGETVIRLSEQSQSIEEIISAVKDLAEQSNLLAVNAAIEAARAGEQGKGFAVVAEEIKSLADQSKRSTDQIKTILDDIRNSISGVVMATERGSKAVAQGTQQSMHAGKAIETVAASVRDASQSLTVIVASSEQQSVGIDQVALAMDNIDRAMQQNVESTRQLEASARDLQDLGQKLKIMVERYKV
ncbi:MAG: methyl-accepting chemotaxis protein [Desulfomonilaceae bacterium]